MSTPQALAATTVNANVNKNSLTVQDPVSTAASSGDLEELKSLIKKKANLNLEDRNRSTPLFGACWFNRERCVRELLQGGVNVSHQNVKLNTALHLACEKCHYSLIMLLVMWGADINLKNQDGKRPFEMTSDPLVEKLCKRTAKCQRGFAMLKPQTREALYSTFGDIDVDGDGTLDFSECVKFNRYLEDVTQESAAQDAEEFFEIVDFDGDKKITQNEWMVAWCKLAESDGPEAVEEFVVAYKLRVTQIGPPGTQPEQKTEQKGANSMVLKLQKPAAATVTKSPQAAKKK
jgi:hypothetical protein